MRFAIILMLLLAITACTSTQIPTTQGTYNQEQFDPDAKLETSNFASDAQYQDFVKNLGASQNTLYRSAGGMMMDAEMMAPSMLKVASAIESSAGMDADYSTTNVQVAGIDEADIIKTDGEYIYTTSGTTLYIIKAYPGEDAKIVSELKFKSAPQGLFIEDDKIAVFGNFYDLDYFKRFDFVPRQGMTFFDIYDVSDKTSPKLEQQFKFEGNYLQSRMNQGIVYFVTVTNPEVRTQYPTPVFMEGDQISRVSPQDIYYFPMPYDYAQLATIHSIDLTREQKLDSKSVAVEGGQNLYMSDDNIFITYTKYINEWTIREQAMQELIEPELTASDKALIEKIKNADNELLNQAEKQSKISGILYTYVAYMDTKDQQDFQDKVEEAVTKKLEEYEYMEWTVINRVSVKAGEVSVEANGKVPGHIINQFSMDEHAGVFRIATTISPRWNAWSKTGEQETVSSSNVYALNSGLKQMGSLTGLAKGEQIYSTRFIGERLYMVTFRQVDPFFVIDLSDPDDIKSLGQLKIPGFSRYLHPYDDNTIIGIGRDASATTGQTRGLKISLFDVRDVANPKETAKWVSDERYAQSAAEYEHKAFLFSKEKELLVIPAYSYSWDGRMDTSSYNGAMVFKITKDDIEMRGIIDHSQGLSEYYYGPTVERSLYINELLYTKSQGLLRINKIEDLSKVNNIEFEGAKSPYPLY